jgi:predicted phosphoribosyltransferase
MKPYFKDRSDAGKKLAKKLAVYKKANPLILAIPRDGVLCGIEIASALHAPLDTLVVRRLGFSYDRHYVVGALAPGNITVVDDAVLNQLGLGRFELEEIVKDQQKELYNLMVQYRSGLRSKLPVGCTTIILVEDGIAEPYVMLAAVLYAKKTYPDKTIVVASPVVYYEAFSKLSESVTVETLHIVKEFPQQENWFEVQNVLTDDEVTNLMNQRISTY